MAITFYDLCGKDGARFSPYGWRTRMALAHKGLDYDLELVKFTEKEKVAFSGQKLVPVIRYGETVVADSFAIACFLEDAFPDKPSLFGSPEVGTAGRGMAKVINGFVDRMVQPLIAPLIVADVFDCVDETCREYFRTSREQRFGMTLAEFQSKRDEKVAAFRTALEPIRLVVKDQPFIGGTAPTYADYILFGSMQWARLTSTFQLVEGDDPIHAWFERVLDSNGGIARQEPIVAKAA
ncbi:MULTISPECIES: glutathione S-transferase family protein [Thalassobaculum]|uniref:Glutathione S-transferase n=1 Tax=Thalassobaculum litoreum DSM 18839 TaxID=1123362 RepID=A0A8G2BLH9_9PROT|nr:MULTISPECIES: glutathione S-transferase family protein [Thalassobaculum]SDG05056.1 Glutathione S-transferase [Thalassobaculum litoreum DSM 18839]